MVQRAIVIFKSKNLFKKEVLEKIGGFKYERYGWGWIPRSIEKPIICPKCKSPYWNKPKKNKKKE